MSLRRFAHNNAKASNSPASPSPRISNASPAPSTPRPRVSYANSPSSTPSISSSVPFDWDAARSRKPPPYSTPVAGKRKPRASVGTPKKVVRKKSIVERISAIPSRIAFEIALFPHNVPLPAPRTSAWLIGAGMHLLHLCVRVAQFSAVPDSDLGWEDMFRENEDVPWFDWTIPTTFLLLAASTLNALHLFTQNRTYRMHQRLDPVSSPHATFVPSPSRSDSPSPDPVPTPPLTTRLLRLLLSILSLVWTSFLVFFRFLFGINTASPSTSMPALKRTREIQQIEVWTPGELERSLFCVYSPAHALLWMATGPTNWMIMTITMGLVGLQMHVLVAAYEALLKDREIIAAEVMNEYNLGFVYPRVNPVRRDVAVMTHQSEVVNVWED